jgi:hypothetical protein
MPDGRPSDDDDHAWLLARERGEPGPAISDVRARRYAQLGTLIADLPAVPAAITQRPDWEQAVLAAIDAEVSRPPGQNEAPQAAVTETPLPERPAAKTRRWRNTATAAAAVFAMAAGVAIVLFMHQGGRPEVRGGAGGVAGQAGRSGPSQPAVEVTRGMHVEQRRLGVDLALQVRRSQTAVRHELRDSDTVMTGDRISASVMTSTDAYLVLAFCKNQHLQIYPSQRGVRTRAGDLVLVPEGGSELVVDGPPGSEVLYLILSQNELSLADPHLAELVLAASGGTTVVDCGANLDVRVTKSGSSPPTSVLRGETLAKKRVPRSRADSAEAPDLARNPGDAVWYTTDEAHGPGTVVAADPDGIAIVRYRLIHVEPEPVNEP